MTFKQRIGKPWLIWIHILSRSNRLDLPDSPNRLIPPILFWLVAISVCSLVAVLPAQQIHVQLSGEQVYVGQALTLEIQISQAEEIREPVLPQIDGVTIEKTGTPSRRIVTTIINNSRRQTQTVIYSFRLTPQQAGEYRIPAFTITADSKKFEVESRQFQALVSETGDLLFAEIDTPLTEAYVGQPVPLTLKIWLAPYTDEERKIRLTERDMWQLLSRQSQKNWGIFSKRLQELADKRQRPAGNLVYRDQVDGSQGAYYLYEIETSFYPQRPGPLNLPEFTVAGEYPTGLGRSRGMGSVFEDEAWTGFDRLFGESPFRSDRLAITASRPISVIAKSPAVEIIDIPSLGRPEDYRGAVGRYKMIAKASADEVKTGDPINLQLLIQGDGPMDSLPGPRLTSYPPLTDNFVVSEDPAAGIVQDGVKLFWTTIRPKHPGVGEIPPLPFSFFDPQLREFKTVYSPSIPIRVLPGDPLSLDSITGLTPEPLPKNPAEPGSSGGETDRDDWKARFWLDHHSPAEILAWTPASKIWTWLWLSPPVVFLLWLGILQRRRFLSLMPGLAKPDWLTELRKAKTCGELASIIERHCVPPLTNDLQKIQQSCLKAAYGGGAQESFFQLQAELERSLRERDRLSSTLGNQRLKPSRLAQVVLAVLGCSLISAAVPDRPDDSDPAPAPSRWIPLSETQLQQMLIEADRWLEPAIGFRSRFPGQSQAGKLERSTAGSPIGLPTGLELGPESMLQNLSEEEQRIRLAQGIERYRTILSSGFKNPRLLNNLGNAYLAIDEIVLAAASFEDGWRQDPDDYRLLRKLKTVKSKMSDPEPAAASAIPWDCRLLEANQWIPTRFSRVCAWAIWLSGWVWLANRLTRPTSQSPFVWLKNRERGIARGGTRWLCWSAIAMMGLLLWTSWQLNYSWNWGDPSVRSTWTNWAYDGVALSDGVAVRTADDATFPVVGRLHAYQPIRQAARRGGWTKIITLKGDFSGWVKTSEIYSFRSLAGASVDSP
jgi:hypothetical protein